MTDSQLDRLVTLIVARLQPPVLVMVTPGTGYRDAIRQRLAGCGERLHLALDDGLEDALQWQALGETQLATDGPITRYKAVVVPFLDYPLAVDLVSGTLKNPVARRLHDALLAGIPVLALRYHCCPHSELNQLRGAVEDSAYVAHVDATLAQLTNCGVSLCTMNALLEELALGSAQAAPIETTRRYLTVTDIVNNPSLAEKPNAVMTDAAVDYLKAQRKITLPQ